MKFNAKDLKYYAAFIKLFDSTAAIEYKFEKPGEETREEFEARINYVRYKIPAYETIDSIEGSPYDFAGTVIRKVCSRGIARENIYVNMQPLAKWMYNHGLSEKDLFNEKKPLF